MMAGRAKKNHKIFRHLIMTTSWGLWGVQKYNITENNVYSPGGAQKYFFSKHVVINAHRTNILENKILGPSTYPPCQIFQKVQKIVQYIEKIRIFSKKFRVTSATKFAPNILKFRNTTFCSYNTAHKQEIPVMTRFCKNHQFWCTIFALFDPIQNMFMKNACQGILPDVKIVTSGRTAKDHRLVTFHQNVKLFKNPLEWYYKHSFRKF